MLSHSPTAANQLQAVMIYAADLELEVDRLRRKDRFVQQEAWERARHILHLCDHAPESQDPADALPAIAASCREFVEVLRDLADPPGYHPAFDQVTDIAIRPLVEQIFRWQQRINGVESAVLRFDLQPEHIAWFPVRLRHILDNLIAHALRFPDPAKGEVRVSLSLRVDREEYELQLTDNGLGIPSAEVDSMTEFFYRAAPARAANLDVGFAVVKLLVEQSCGSISVRSGEKQGTNVTLKLPQYAVDDYID